jgi:hypothetical protein
MRNPLMEGDESFREPNWRNLTREDLENGYVTRLNRPYFGKPDIRLVEFNGHRAIHKDIREKPCLVRSTIGSWLINREYRVYRRLGGCSGVPRLHCRPDRWSILVEYIEGESLKRGDPRLRNLGFFRRLDGLVAAIHARGIVHLDLRHKGNIMITEGGEPYVIDFNSSFYLGGSVLGRRILPWLKAIDRVGLLKLKQRVAPELLTEQETVRLRWFDVLRRLWIFN